jgi:hypothetical protein
LQTYRIGDRSSDKQAGVAHLEKSLAYWDEVVAITRPIYKDMPLTHYNPPDNRRNDDNLFHWARLRPAIASDVQLAGMQPFIDPAGSRHHLFPSEQEILARVGASA